MRGGASSAAGPSASGDLPPSAVAELARVEDLYRATSFTQCVEEARRLLAPKNPEGVKRPTEVDRARTYLAACLVRSGDGPGGEREFEQAIRAALTENRAFPRPNSLVFPEEVVERFDAARRRLEAEIEEKRRDALAAAQDERTETVRARDSELERQRRLMELAAQESVVVQNRRWLAAVPFGVGQFQNRRPALGWTFLVSELAALGLVIGGLSAELTFSDQLGGAIDELDDGERRRLNAAWDRARVVWLAGFYGFCGLAAAGIAEAELRYVPEFRTVRPRPVPSELQAPSSAAPRARGPFLAPSPAGVGLGFGLRF